MKANIRGNKGQVAVEYILMIAVVVAMITSIMAIVRKRYLVDISKCKEPANEKALTCKLDGIFSADAGGNKRFQYYPFKK